MRRTLIVTTSLLLTLNAARALDKNGEGMVYGAGMRSCGAYTSARKSNADGSFSEWLSGYLSATNFYINETYDIAGQTDLPGDLSWLDNLCQTNPAKQFSTAASELVMYLYPRRLKQNR
jgi:hypothetical protein